MKNWIRELIESAFDMEELETALLDEISDMIDYNDVAREILDEFDVTEIAKEIAEEKL